MSAATGTGRSRQISAGIGPECSRPLRISHIRIHLQAFFILKM